MDFFNFCAEYLAQKKFSQARGHGGRFGVGLNTPRQEIIVWDSYFNSLPFPQKLNTLSHQLVLSF